MTLRKRLRLLLGQVVEVGTAAGLVRGTLVRVLTDSIELSEVPIVPYEPAEPVVVRLAEVDFVRTGVE